jgi:hypothetical protein
VLALLLIRLMKCTSICYLWSRNVFKIWIFI